MKTRIALLILASAALISFGATRISKVNKPAVHAASSTGTIGGIAAEDK